ncbi:MAG TPA: type II toxin-antitoxin system PemK/MazF family toxin, partial [Candidatus Methylomirabilis sp.]|nr:type II toxin-antitoxin system PemK/MazF family toxin [Candidatus Methylomirabilis sp.]
SHILISSVHAEFSETGLKQATIIRLDKLMTISRSRVRRRLGHLGPLLLAELDSHLKSAFGL